MQEIDMKMTRHRWIAVGIGVAVFLAAFSVALAVTIRFQVSRQVPSNLNVFEVSVLKDERLGLYFDKEATKPVDGLNFGLLKLKEPLRSHETGTRSVFVRNESGIDLFLIEPCRDVEVDGKHIGFMNPEIFDLEGNKRGSACDRPRVRLTPGEMVEARVNVHDLTQELEAKSYGFTTVFGAVGSRRSVEPPAGMIGWWPGDLSAIDLVGGNNGTMRGDAEFKEGFVGHAFSFDGSGDDVQIPHDTSLNLNHFTIDAWVWPAEGKGQAIVSKGLSPSPPRLSVANGKLHVTFDPGGVKASSNATISPDRWNHVAATYDGQSVNIYIDGKEDVKQPFTGTPVVNDQPMFIGQRGDNNSYFQGMIDEVEIFNRALNGEEIGSIYNAGRAGKIKPRIALNPANGHVYEVVFGPEPFPWDVAKDEAAKRTFGGRQGHLATITSQQENDFIFASFQEVGDGCCWLGGHQPGDTPAQDPDPAAGWQWVTGEPFTYTNWAPGEPNDAGGQEDILAFHPGHPGKWNDVPGAGKAGGYLVEFEPAPTPAPSGAWTTKAPVPVASNGPSVGAINGLVYAVAGWNNNQGSALRVYDPATNTWTEKAPRPNIGSDKSHGAINGVLYEAGGTDCCVVVNSVFAYDPATNSWSTKAEMPTKRSRAASGVIGDKLYVAGGHDFSGSTLILKANLEAYDTVSNSWTTLAAMPTARSAAGGGVVNGILYVVGGAIGTSATVPVGAVEAYDPATNTWSTKAPMPTPRHMVGVAVIGNILYAIGGHGPNSGNFVTTVEAYDPATNTWSTKAAMPTPRAHFGIAEVGGTIYVIGGDAAAGVINTVEAFTP